MIRGDADGRDVSRVVRFDKTDDEADHRAAMRDRAVGDGFRRSQKIFKRVAAVGFAVNKATLIQTPALIELRNRQRPHVVAHFQDRRRSLRLIPGNRLDRLFALRPPARTNFLQDSHKKSNR